MTRGVATVFAAGYRAAPNAAESFVLHRHRNRQTSRPGVLSIGGMGTVASIWLSTTFRTQPDLVANSGLVNFGSDQGGPATWGNDVAKAAVDEMFDYLVGAGGADPAKKIGIMCGSMGCPVACNWARENIEKVGCIHMTVPAVDVEDIRANNRSGLAAGIETAYTDNATWQAARPTHNPAEYAEELAGIPHRILYSTNDPICTPETVTDYADAVGANLVSLGAVGHIGTGQDYVASNAWVLSQLDL